MAELFRQHDGCWNRAHSHTEICGDKEFAGYRVETKAAGSLLASLGEFDVEEKNIDELGTEFYDGYFQLLLMCLLTVTERSVERLVQVEVESRVNVVDCWHGLDQKPPPFLQQVVTGSVAESEEIWYGLLSLRSGR